MCPGRSPPSPSTSPPGSRSSRPAPSTRAPAALGSPASAGVGGIFSDIAHFTENVVQGSEQVAELAWQSTEDAVQTVIHTAESVYNLVITDVDAVTAVVGFLKTVVAEISKIIQWLSALFNWENILHNHAYIKRSITNPGDPANPGILDRLAGWVASELTGGTDAAAFPPQLSSRSSVVVGSTAQATAGQTVQSQQAGNNDPSQVYNTGGNNNANQCTWMHEKVTENSSSASIGGGSAHRGRSILGPRDHQRRVRAVPDRPGKRADRLVRRPARADPGEDRRHPGQLQGLEIRAEHRPVGHARRIPGAGRRHGRLRRDDGQGLPATPRYLAQPDHGLAQRASRHPLRFRALPSPDRRPAQHPRPDLPARCRPGYHPARRHHRLADGARHHHRRARPSRRPGQAGVGGHRRPDPARHLKLPHRHRRPGAGHSPAEHLLGMERRGRQARR